MFTYYLCNDGETIYRIEFSLKQEDKKEYLSLIENYLGELIFVEEAEQKKLMKEEQIKKEGKDTFSIDDYKIFLKKTTVMSFDKIEEYLPFVVTLKTRKYFLLRFWTICILIKLFLADCNEFENPDVNKIAHLLGNSQYIDFSLIYSVFFDESGNLFPERFYDYDSLMRLLKKLDITITEKYSRSALINFWQGDEAERELADGIVSDSLTNKKALKKLNYEPIMK